MLVGTIQSHTGACPVCGLDVRLTHATNPQGVTDAYACPTCGPTTYRVWAFTPSS